MGVGWGAGGYSPAGMGSHSLAGSWGHHWCCKSCSAAAPTQRAQIAAGVGADGPKASLQWGRGMQEARGRGTVRPGGLVWVWEPRQPVAHPQPRRVRLPSTVHRAPPKLPSLPRAPASARPLQPPGDGAGPRKRSFLAAEGARASPQLCRPSPCSELSPGRALHPFRAHSPISRGFGKLQPGAAVSQGPRARGPAGFTAGATLLPRSTKDGLPRAKGAGLSAAPGSLLAP